MARGFLPCLSMAVVALWPMPVAAQSIDRILAAAAERRAGDCGGTAAANDDEIVVCARDDRHRLPLPVERDPQATGAVAGEVPRASATDPFLSGCGIFKGQGRCSRREAEAYGYGRGRDPVTLVGRLIRKAADPDAEVGTAAAPAPDARR